jgi:serine/threonine protein kinase
MSGVVRLATHRQTGEKVAIKSFDLRAMTRRSRHDMCREMGVQSSLDHPSVAKVRASFWSERTSFGHLVTECLEGGTVFDQIQEVNTVSECQARIVATQLLQALEYLHGLGLCHRDVKLENVVYTDEARDQVKLIDFGLCCKWREGSAPMYRVCGTKAYVAPEVVKACYTNKADMWSLGVTVHAMLTGDIIGRGKDGTPVMSKKLGLCSPKVREFIEALLAPDPAARMSASEALGHGWLQDSKKLEGGRPRTCTEGTESTMDTMTPTENIFSQESLIGDDVAQGADPSPSDLETHKFQDGTPSRPRKAVGLVRLVRSLWSAVRGKKASVAPEPMESIVPRPSAR